MNSIRMTSRLDTATSTTIDNGERRISSSNNAISSMKNGRQRSAAAATTSIRKRIRDQLRRRRRSNSAPPRYGRRSSLLKEHYCIDQEKRIVLPGVPKHEADWARDGHDLFNLVVLIPVIVLNIMNWNWDALLSMTSVRDVSDAWTGEWFLTFYTYVQSYFLADLAWILLIPSCVRSPKTILQHHVATMLYMLIPWFYPELRFFMGAALSVEVNTWFLISRRVFNKQGFPCWTIDLPPFVSIRIKLISIFFYLTWFTIRIFLYPLILWDFVQRYYETVQQTGNLANIYAAILPLHSCFVILNIKWTQELIMSKIRYFKRGGKDAVSKGL